jgi:hypothetical protein
MQNYHIHNRPDREITDKSAIYAILKNGKYMVVAMCRGNEPYVVTLSYGYDSENNALYFHCSPLGLKLDFIRANPLVCATVIEDGGYAYGECAHNYRTAVFWGSMKIVDDLDEKKHGMHILLEHLEKEPEVIKEKLLKSDAFYSKMAILRLDISQIHGKAGR